MSPRWPISWNASLHQVKVYRYLGAGPGAAYRCPWPRWLEADGLPRAAFSGTLAGRSWRSEATLGPIVVSHVLTAATQPSTVDEHPFR